MPLALHESTGQPERTRTRPPLGHPEAERILFTTRLVHEIQLTILELIYTRVLERHPTLKVVCTEVEMGWVMPVSNAHQSTMSALRVRMTP